MGRIVSNSTTTPFNITGNLSSTSIAQASLAPLTPNIYFPPPGSLLTSIAPAFSSSPFASPAGSLHRATNWVIATATDFSNPIYNLVSTTQLTALDMYNIGALSALPRTTGPIYIKNRYISSAYEVSDFSPTITYTLQPGLSAATFWGINNRFLVQITYNGTGNASNCTLSIGTDSAMTSSVYTNTTAFTGQEAVFKGSSSWSNSIQTTLNVQSAVSSRNINIAEFLVPLSAMTALISGGKTYFAQMSCGGANCIAFSANQLLTNEYLGSTFALPSPSAFYYDTLNSITLSANFGTDASPNWGSGLVMRFSGPSAVGNWPSNTRSTNWTLAPSGLSARGLFSNTESFSSTLSVAATAGGGFGSARTVAPGISSRANGATFIRSTFYIPDSTGTPIIYSPGYTSTTFGIPLSGVRVSRSIFEYTTTPQVSSTRGSATIPSNYNGIVYVDLIGGGGGGSAVFNYTYSQAGGGGGGGNRVTASYNVTGGEVYEYLVGFGASGGRDGMFGDSQPAWTYGSPVQRAGQTSYFHIRTTSVTAFASGGQSAGTSGSVAMYLSGAGGSYSVASGALSAINNGGRGAQGGNTSIPSLTDPTSPATTTNQNWSFTYSQSAFANGGSQYYRGGGGGAGYGAGGGGGGFYVIRNQTDPYKESYWNGGGGGGGHPGVFPGSTGGAGTFATVGGWAYYYESNGGILNGSNEARGGNGAGGYIVVIYPNW